MRIARGYTGRDKVLFCGYYGWHDWYLAANLENHGVHDTHLPPGIRPQGVPQGLQQTAIAVTAGDAAQKRGVKDYYVQEMTRRASSPRSG